MTTARFKTRVFLREFAHCEKGTASLEFVIVFPIFFAFFLMTYESGMVNAQHVMLDPGPRWALWPGVGITRRANVSCCASRVLKVAVTAIS